VQYKVAARLKGFCNSFREDHRSISGSGYFNQWNIFSETTYIIIIQSSPQESQA
jgi:hypothetical protein